jgi:uncharacterized protein (DUF2336 family)
MDYLKSFPALEGLVDLANRDDIDINPTLLRVLTDFYVTRPTHSSEEERQYIELALRLLDTVDVSARQRLAQQLANYAQAPLPVVARLARDAIAVAEPILRRSSLLTDAELRSIAQASSPAHVAAIAARGRMDAREPSAGNAHGADPFARNSAAASELSELFFAANSAERRLILLNLDFARLPPGKPIAAQSASEAVRRLEAAALAHNVETFVRELARALAISPDQARRLSQDQSGEPLVIAARALGMPADALQRILLCLNPVIGQSVQRVYELADLYEELAPDAALRMVAIWQITEHRPPRPAHQPQYWNERTPPRPDAATAERRISQTRLPDRRAGTKRS